MAPYTPSPTLPGELPPGADTIMGLILTWAGTVGILLLIGAFLFLLSKHRTDHEPARKSLPATGSLPNSLLLDGRQKLAGWPDEVEWYDEQARIAGIRFRPSKEGMQYVPEEP